MEKAIEKLEKELNDLLKYFILDASFELEKEFEKHRKVIKLAGTQLGYSIRTLNEFADFSQEFFDSEAHIEKEENINTIHYMLNFIKYDIDTIKSNRLLFLRFHELSTILETFDFRVKESMAIIEFFLDRNLKCLEYLDEKVPTVIIGVEDIKNIVLSNEDKKIAKHLFESNIIDKLEGFVDLTEVTVTPKENEIIHKILEYKEQNIEKENQYFAELKNVHHLLKRHYLDKEVELKDIKFITKGLQVLGISDSLVSKIEFYLKNKVEKKANKNVSTYVAKPKVVEEKEVLSSKEYNKIYHEIASMYNLEENRAIKPLQLNELIYLVSLMVKIGVKEEVIISCIKNVYKDFYNGYDDPLVFFETYYEKLVFYSDNEEIKESLELLKDMASEMKASPKDYFSWKFLMKEEMEKNYNLLAKKYQYELEKGRSLN